MQHYGRRVPVSYPVYVSSSIIYAATLPTNTQAIPYESESTIACSYNQGPIDPSPLTALLQMFDLHAMPSRSYSFKTSEAD